MSVRPRNAAALGFALSLLFCTLPVAHAQDGHKGHGLKFGLYALQHPAFGVAFAPGRMTQHLQLDFDGDLILEDATFLILDVSLRYHFDRRRSAHTYAGGGAGIAFAGENTTPAHLLAGFEFELDALPAFLEVKLHLADPSAFTLWFGLRY